MYQFKRMNIFAGLRRVRQNVCQRHQAEATFRHCARCSQELRVPNLQSAVQSQVRKKAVDLSIHSLCPYLLLDCVPCVLSWEFVRKAEGNKNCNVKNQSMCNTLAFWTSIPTLTSVVTGHYYVNAKLTQSFNLLGP